MITVAELQATKTTIVFAFFTRENLFPQNYLEKIQRNDT